MTCALVLGSASCLQDDLDALDALAGPWSGIVVACNDAGWLYPGRLDHWASLHPERFPDWLPRREDAIATLWTTPESMRDGDELRRHPHEVRDLAPWWHKHGNSGSSGMLAVQVALLHADRAVLCGMPLDTRAHRPGVIGPPPGGFDMAHAFRETWEAQTPRMVDRVRSLSGWTKDLLGEPSKHWIEGTEPEPVEIP
jgi:hypothetical protein